MRWLRCLRECAEREVDERLTALMGIREDGTIANHWRYWHYLKFGKQVRSAR